MDSRSHPYRVLAIGLSDDTRSMVCRYLKGSSVRVETADSGDDMCGWVNGNAPDLVIVNSDSRESVGLPLVRQLRAKPETSALPVMLIADSEDCRADCLSAGVDEFLTRAVTQTEFMDRLDTLLRVSNGRRTLAVALEKEIRRREQIRETFARYVSPALVDQILAEPTLRRSALANKGSRVRASVLFADMRGFTRISEQLAPTEVVPLLNEYFELLTEIAFKYDGTVFNMAGDCLMVGFGVPLDQPDRSLRAVKTAREMLIRFRGLVEQWKRRHDIETGLGIGINEGEVIAGNIGSSEYMSYTIIGDAVNVASRLGQRARAGEMLFSQEVKQSLDEAGFDVDAVELPSLVLRGRAAPVQIFCVPVDERLDIRDP